MKMMFHVVMLSVALSVTAGDVGGMDGLPAEDRSLAVAVANGKAFTSALLAKEDSPTNSTILVYDSAVTLLDGKEVAIKGSVASVSKTWKSCIAGYVKGDPGREYVVSVSVGSVRQQPVTVDCLVSSKCSDGCSALKVGQGVVLSGKFVGDGFAIGGHRLCDASFVPDKAYGKAEEMLRKAGDSLLADCLVLPAPFLSLDGKVRRRLCEKAECALAAYPGMGIPSGYRPFTRKEWTAVAEEAGYAEEVYSDDGYLVLGNGLRGRLMVHRLTGRTVVAWSGCDLNGKDALTAGPIDVITCMKNFLAEDDDAQFRQAKEICSGVVKVMSGRVWIVGHSLGGSLAAYAVLALGDVGDRLEAATFNGLGMLRKQYSAMDATARAGAARRLVNVYSDGDPVFALDNLSMLKRLNCELIHPGRSYFLESPEIRVRIEDPLMDVLHAIQQCHGLEELCRQMEEQSPRGYGRWIVVALIVAGALIFLVCVVLLVRKVYLRG